MEETIKLVTPLTEDKVRKLKAGDFVLITGTIYTARDAAHKRMVEALAAGEKLPADFTDQIIYYVGPTPAKPGRPIGSAGPTTSGRMDAYAPRIMEEGLRGMIGKGYRSPEVVEAMKKHGAVYFTATGGAAALIARTIKKYEIIAYEDLGPEALARLTVEDFPAIVVIDSEGRNFYDEGQKKYRNITC
ncbi:Fe-S-containing hydro-lyase [Sporomusa acidovorans]|uniref:Fumarate hydratase class I, anaerobic n=1 Tax=Sporomusa acidovorans (strain ATCC 49682 / DSM 3132 / Mol) TaxID=1123286 RepID=A0ABZ3J0Z2_SPOA4|nr:Fe-S-containing hydro-lyase [Sporomusa acidovorans]OZC22804.1 fumarate hydratase class I, anaerobic [Sporomusa acidovorans DSM 3132]SDE51441.1 fumarate hydratase subunit beta [Sporomusa acidovorans]